MLGYEEAAFVWGPITFLNSQPTTHFAHILVSKKSHFICYLKIETKGGKKKTFQAMGQFLNGLLNSIPKC